MASDCHIGQHRSLPPPHGIEDLSHFLLSLFLVSSFIPTTSLYASSILNFILSVEAAVDGFKQSSGLNSHYEDRCGHWEVNGV